MPSNIDKLNILRNLQLCPTDFRYYSSLIFQEMAKNLAHRIPPKKVHLIAILRSGVAMLHPFLQIFPTATVGFLGIERDESTAIPHLYYTKISPFSFDDYLFILEPMVATGGTVTMAIDHLKNLGGDESQMHVIGLICAKPGIDRLAKRFPYLQIHMHEKDPQLDQQHRIRPGLGDFGNRYFGTEKTG